MKKMVKRNRSPQMKKNHNQTLKRKSKKKKRLRPRKKRPKLTTYDLIKK